MIRGTFWTLLFQCKDNQFAIGRTKQKHPHALECSTECSETTKIPPRASELKRVLVHSLTRSTKLQVPPEAFRLGRTRVFFRAGQISTLQKILNETSAEKGPWIFERLQEALENRRKAKAAAEEARVIPRVLGTRCVHVCVCLCSLISSVSCNCSSFTISLVYIFLSSCCLTLRRNRSLDRSARLYPGSALQYGVRGAMDYDCQHSRALRRLSSNFARIGRIISRPKITSSLAV